MPEKNADENIEINFGGGKISFGGLFQGLGNVIDLMSRMEETGQDGVSQEQEFTSPSGRVKAVYGLSVKRGLGGRPTVESFGNVKKTAKGPVVEEEREPLVDVFDEEEQIVVIVELPGVEEEHIHTEVQEASITVSAVNGERKYYKEIALPKAVETSTVKSKYRNGVLEIRIGKK